MVAVKDYPDPRTQTRPDPDPKPTPRPQPGPRPRPEPIGGYILHVESESALLLGFATES